MLSANLNSGLQSFTDAGGWLERAGVQTVKIPSRTVTLALRAALFIQIPVTTADASPYHPKSVRHSILKRPQRHHTPVRLLPYHDS